MFNAFIYGETLRFARNTNNIEDFNEKVDTFKNKLTARGYTHDELNTQIHKVSHHERTNLIHKTLEVPQQNEKNPLVFSTTYNPALFHKDISRAISKYWPLIQSDDTLTHDEINTRDRFVSHPVFVSLAMMVFDCPRHLSSSVREIFAEY